MKISKQDRQTRLVELVETHNIALSLDRINKAPSWTSYRWRRALYHALGMSDQVSQNMLEAVRKALELP